VTLLVTALVAPTALAQPFDHLQCFKLRDTLARANATADLAPEQNPPFPLAPGCRIKLPAKYFCVDVAKQNLQPPPALPIGGDDARDYFCYKVACPKNASAPRGGMPLEAEDQFGRRTVFIKTSPFFCAPARKVVTTPTPTPTPTPNNVGCGQLPPGQCSLGDCGPISDCVLGVGGICRCEPPTPTPTPGGPAPTASHDPGCSFDGDECQGGCMTTGRCVWMTSQARCICPAFFDGDCPHTIELGQCSSGMCYGPNQECRSIPNPTAEPCGCFPRPTPTATP
jgi:hypothetical protein